MLLAWFERDWLYGLAVVCGLVVCGLRYGPSLRCRLPVMATATTQAPSTRHLAILPYEELIERTGARRVLDRLRQQLAFTPENFSRDVEPLLQRCGEFVQLLPATQTAQLSQDCSLFMHIMSLARDALHYRNAYALPVGRGAEEQARLAARYSYAVLAMAVLQGVAQGLVAFGVEICDAQGGQRRPWIVLGGTMCEQGGAWYTFEPVQPHSSSQRLDHRQAGQLALILLQRFIPRPVLAWLGEHPPVLNELLDALSRESQSNPMARIVARASQPVMAKTGLVMPASEGVSNSSATVTEASTETQLAFPAYLEAQDSALSLWTSRPQAD
ncbi:TraI domain-containing protein [Mycoavidus sp. SF9855]|uniref:TraI domain-containing protein n=1 Tax=Mycoavidus sp. SF9855 TaxID=2968475 RepID=UPI00211C7917|nr:TraI domain-containing protein [Mycoavidus sp. SF9855]UUM22147.1 TraI domain-containing protein [Mycoavidus sp. SF9855]